MVARRRLDAELVRRKMARSREHAVEMIRGGRVLVGGYARGETCDGRGWGGVDTCD